MAIVTLDDVDTSSNDSGASSENNSGSDSVDEQFRELEETCDTIGADFENAKGRAVNDDGVDLDDLITVATNLAGENGEELFVVMELYRMWNDQKRIVTNYLYNLDAEFGAFLDKFWGENDDPEPGTYNYVRNQSRERDDNPGGLFTYKALFPEPAEAHWDDDVVQLIERPDDDSHIYVPMEWVETYTNTMEVNGREVPRPPTNAELEQGATSDDTSDLKLPFDPAEFTIDELKDELQQVDYDAEQLEAALESEKSGKARKGAKNALRDALDDAESSGGASSSSDNDEPSNAVKAGRIVGENNLDVNPDGVAGMLDSGMTEDEIVNVLS